MKKIFFSVVIIGVCLGIFSAITGQITHQRIQERKSYWTKLMETEIPIGSTSQEIEEWNKRHDLNMRWVGGRDFYNGNVEQVPDAGIGFPCSQWNVIIDIHVGLDGKSTSQNVHSVGTCI